MCRPFEYSGRAPVFRRRCLMDAGENTWNLVNFFLEQVVSRDRKRNKTQVPRFRPAERSRIDNLRTNGTLAKSFDHN